MSVKKSKKSFDQLNVEVLNVEEQKQVTGGTGTGADWIVTMVQP